MAVNDAFSKLVKFDLDTLRRSISAARMNARLTQEDVASTIGCSRKWVSRFERGLSVPDFAIVIAYASMFGVKIFMSTPDVLTDMTVPSKGVSNFE
jgi:DNA-binding XRE family transcriptional regulator